MAERRRKNKRKIMICVLGVIILILIIFWIIFSNRKNENTKITEIEETPVISESVYELPDTTYNGMTVTDISLEYLEEQNKTLVSFMINNTTDETIEKETATAYLLNDSGEVLANTKSTIIKLGAGEQCKTNVVLEGDLSATKQITLQRNETSTEEKNENVDNQTTNKIDEEKTVVNVENEVKIENNVESKAENVTENNIQNENTNV